MWQESRGREKAVCSFHKKEMRTMDKYVMAILVLMPGFLAISTAEKLGKTHTKKSGVSLALAYAAYTVVILLITMSVSLLWSDSSVTMQQAINGEMPLSFYVLLMAVSVAASIAVGAVWALFLSDCILQKINKVNAMRGKNIRWEEGSLFHHLFNDGKPHFVIIRKDGEDVAVGFFYACSNPQDDKEELSITEYPEYREEWNRVKEGEKDSYLYITEQTYFDVSSGLTVIETQYPPEWLNDDQKKDSEEPVKDETAESSDAKAC